MAVLETLGLPPACTGLTTAAPLALGLQVAGIVLVVVAISGFTALQWRLAARQRRAAQQAQRGQPETGRHAC